jgi:hypothetical protein
MNLFAQKLINENQIIVMHVEEVKYIFTKSARAIFIKYIVVS